MRLFLKKHSPGVPSIGKGSGGMIPVRNPVIALSSWHLEPDW
jgi:hypothetical protein